MSKNKTHKHNEHYEGIIKNLKSQIRNLQKELKYLRKRNHISDDIIAGANEHEEPEEKGERCTECARGELSTIIIANRMFKRCDTCGYRSKAIKTSPDKDRK